ncbi:uncharacterized protein LOC105207956 isoform X2 [Solenopsis invicta]|uniref:uncharacterized protein LOC105207956 isoform X2 n=1 Tax=Solenopsis invicta TaxID=13686 RepID=UPI000E340244|nr:uncharacterized protein LOC105207956 isoform X2 [Solenopsis invicta]
MTTRGAICLLLSISTLGGSLGSTRYFVKMRTNASDMFKTKVDNFRILQDPIAITPNPLYDNSAGTEHQVDDGRMTKEISSDQYNRRNSFVESSTFNPDALNKFLEEYANKVKSTTERNFKYPFRIVKPPAEPLVLEIDSETTTVRQDETFDQISNATSTDDALGETLNDTLKRNKYYGTNTYEDRNGWVTLEAIPWSKSKISKWQANPSTQRPWPEIKPWDKPSMKPWASDFTIRPTYENNKPWYDKPKPNWSDNEKPWQKPSSRPPYRPDEASNQAQKWPPEKPWNKYDLQRPSSDIITDDRPANFPSSWSRPQSSLYQFIDRYSEKDQSGDGSNWHDYPSRYEQDRPRPTLITERPNFSHYQYVNNHPPSHPASGDGQWVLLSTNRGYSKSRQRSIKIDAINAAEPFKEINLTDHGNKDRQDEEPPIAVMTSKRQIDGVAIDQRHEHDDVPRRSSGSREDIQERRAEPQGVRDGEVVGRTEHPEYSAYLEHHKQKTNQAHNSDKRETVEFGRSSSRRSRYAAGDNGDDDTDDAGSSKERSETDGTHAEQQSRSQSA